MDNLAILNRELEVLRYAINNSEEEIYACSPEGSFIFANGLSAENHNLKDDLSSHTIFDLNIVEFSGEKWIAFVQSLRENESIKRLISKRVSNRITTYYDLKANLTVIGGSEIIWFFCKNVTTKILQDSKIKELNYVMDAILSNIPVYLFVKNSANDFRYIYWNKAFEQFSKIPVEKVLGRTDYEVFPNRADAEKFRKDDLTVLHKGNVEFDEEYIDAEGMTRYVHTLKTLINTDTDLPWLMGVSWDITELKNSEKELTKARIKAEQSDKLKSAFLANMSHEIRTPLNAIVGFSKLLGDAEGDERQQYLDIIDENANLLLQLINDILDISKIEAGTLEFVESCVMLNDLFRDIYEIHRLRVGESVTLIYEENETPVSLQCDRNRLLQVITNLITNAVKFTHHGEIRFGFKVVDDDQIEFYVRDTGIGISEKNVGEIFNRFTKLNSFIHGTGLGLSICQTIVEKMCGRIWVESVENVGSTFCFSVPYGGYCKMKTEKDKIIVHRRANKNKEIKTILVAEDIDSSYLLIENMLGKEYNLIRAMNGFEAIAKFDTFSPDLILMDVKMPELDGLEAMRRIRKFSDIPIIVITSFAFESDRKEAMDSGCDDFITKPISFDTLSKSLAKFI